MDYSSSPLNAQDQQKGHSHSIASSLSAAGQVIGAIGAPHPYSVHPTSSTTTAAGTNSLLPPSEAPSRTIHNSMAQGRRPYEQTSAPSSATSSTGPKESQQFGTPRRQHPQRPSADFHIPSNAPPLQYTTPQQSQTQSQYLPSNISPAFELHQASPHSRQANSIVPSNASSTVPGALQPGGGAARSNTSSAFSTPSNLAPMQAPPSQTNASQYNHGHSRSSPAGMGDTSQRYVPFSQSSNQNAASNPKAYNLSHTQPGGAGPSHSPLNLTDIRSRAVSDANDTGMGTGTLVSYSDTPSNSNYLAPFATYAYDWCKWPIQNGSGAGKMAVGSYLEDPHNFIQILDTQITPQEITVPGGAPYGLEYVKIAEATCAYPVTRILWEPPSSQKQSTDLLATSGDHLRLWSLPQSTTQHTSNINRSSAANTREPAPQKLQPLALLSNSKTPEHTAPLTSLDWNTLSPKLIITSSIDTTCTIWDIPTLTAKTQLIAHDKEVFDVRFCAGSVDVFVSCGADGSVRMFDLRSLEHSTIIYEPAEKNDKSSSPTTASPTKAQGQTVSPAPPLLRLAASPHDSHLLATFASDSNLIRILDVRQPGTALLELHGHQGNLNTIEWNPSRRGMLASGADDSMVLIWDLLNSGNQAAVPALTASGAPGQAAEVQGKGPSASWRCEYEVSNLSWSPNSPLTAQGGDWLGVCAGRGVWGVKV